MKPIEVILIGAGQRGNAYAPYALNNPNELKVVGVAEPDQARRQQFKDKYNLPDEDCLVTWEDVFKRDKWGDAVMICTPDNLHYEPTMQAIAQGYDILLEKPISPSEQECLDIADAAAKANVKVVVCHVLRYSPFFEKIKAIIDSGEIGDIVTIAHFENVGDIHHSHSFARGNWGKKDDSSPMILAKCCHDMDIIQWLVGKKCTALSSFGSLKFFCKDYCPEGAPPRCTDGCTVDCPYDARKLYLQGSEWFRSVAAGHYNATDDEVEAAIKTGPYGRCVFQCDNDVVDHQVVNLQFEDDITVMFTMTSLTPDTSRSIKIMGTKGQIKGHTSHKTLIVNNFVTRETREEPVVAVGGHGGGDTGIMIAFCKYLRGEISSAEVSEAGISALNHRLCFKAEASRLAGGELIKL